MIPLTVACGRHSHLALVDNCYCIDMSGYKGVTVSEDKNTVTILGGTCTGEVDLECAKYDVGVTAGNARSVGYPGSGLHGGHGLLEPIHGLGCDNIMELKIVTANGECKVGGVVRRVILRESVLAHP